MPNVIALAPTTSIKPREGRPCNGCGLCCHLEVCAVGELAFGDNTPAPCPALRWGSDRYLCALMAAERAGGLEPLIARVLGAGRGCGMQDLEDAPHA